MQASSAAIGTATERRTCASPCTSKSGTGCSTYWRSKLLEAPDPLDRRRHAPDHVRVDPDLHVAADAVADRGDRVVVLLEVAADLELQLGVARVDERAGLLRVRLGRVDEEVADDRNPVAAEAAEQLRDGDAERLPLQVEQGDLDPGDRVGADPAPVPRELLHAVHEPLDPQRILADEELRQLRVDDRLDRRQRRSGRLADPHQALVGVDLDEQARRRMPGAARPDQRLPHGGPHSDRFDLGDPHRDGYTTARRPRLSTILRLST